MNDNLLTILISGFVSVIAAFAGGYGLGVSQRTSGDWKSSIGKAVHLLLSGILRPFRWVATEIKEWRRVSVYRHQRITWDDLPWESKSTVQFQDLNELVRALIRWDDLPQQAKDNVRFQALSEEARASIRVRDLPLGEKLIILDRFILPQLHDAAHEGTLSLLDDKNSITLSEAAQVTVAREPDYHDERQDGMRLTLDIAFTNPGTGLPLRRGEKIGFTAGRWTTVGSIRQRTRTSSGTQAVTVWVTFLLFDSLAVYSYLN